MSEYYPDLPERIPVDGIGELCWDVRKYRYERPLPPKYDDTSLDEWLDQVANIPRSYEYATPDDNGNFKLILALPTPLRQTGGEAFMVQRLPFGEAMGKEDLVTHDWWDEEGHYPQWLIDFIGELRDWVDASEVWCINNTENEIPPNEILIEVVHDEYRKSPTIHNHGLLLGSLAARLSELKHLPYQS